MRAEGVRRRLYDSWKERQGCCRRDSSELGVHDEWAPRRSAGRRGARARQAAVKALGEAIGVVWGAKRIKFTYP